jgi:tetratricopeptide (TPR) repeat protein
VSTAALVDVILDRFAEDQHEGLQALERVLAQPDTANDLRLLCLRAELLARIPDREAHARARAILQRLEATAGGEAVFWTSKARALSSLKDDRGAVDALVRACDLAPTDARAFEELCIVAYRIRDRATAKTAGEKAVALDAQRVGAVATLGKIADDEDDLAGALDYALRALAVEPNKGKRHHEVGYALNRLRRHREAISAFRRAIMLGPETEALRVGLANALYAVHEYDEALVWYERTIRLGSKHVRHHMRAAEIHTTGGAFARALALLDRALEIAPSADLHRERARVARAMGFDDVAAEAVEASLRLEPNGWRAWDAKITQLLLQARVEEALATATAREGLYPDDLERLEMRAYLGYMTGRAGEALAAGEAARAMGPEEHRAWHALGLGQLANRDYEAAAATLEKAVSLGDYCCCAMALRGVALVALNRRDEAEACLAQTSNRCNEGLPCPRPSCEHLRELRGQLGHPVTAPTRRPPAPAGPPSAEDEAEAEAFYRALARRPDDRGFARSVLEARLKTSRLAESARLRALID